MKLINDNGHPNYGRLESAPTKFNVEDYINPFLTSKWKRKLCYKKFSFIGIRHQHYTIGMAIVDLSWVGHGFYYCFDHISQKFIDFHAIQPLGYKTEVHEIAAMDQPSYFKHRNISIEIQQKHHIRAFQVMRKGDVLCRAEIKSDFFGQPLYLCTPTGIRGWTFTHKSMCLSVKGEFLFEGKTHQFNQSTLASLDDSCGYLRPETEWFWLSAQSEILRQKIGVNIASGVNESCGNENCLWIDGQLYALPDIIFIQRAEDQWQLYSLDQRVELTVRSGWRRYENTNLGFAVSQFSQWVSVLNGTIKIDDNEIQFNDVYSILEQHY